MPLGLGEQKSRRFGGVRLPLSPCVGKHVRASVGPLGLAVALALGLWLSGSPAATAADGSAPPKPQVLWHAYPLSPSQGRTGTVGSVKTRAPHTRPASTPANRPDTAPSAAQTFPAVPLAAAAAAAAAIVAMLVLLRRRRAARHGAVERSHPRPAPRPARRLPHAPSQEDGALAPRAVKRGAAKAGGRTSAVAAGRLTESLLESIGVVPQAHVVQAERVERQVLPKRVRDRPSTEEKEALKRTGETADAEAAAKLKSRGQESAALKQATKRDLSVLKEKLGEPQTEPSRASVQLKRAQGGNGTPAPADHSRTPEHAHATQRQEGRT